MHCFRYNEKLYGEGTKVKVSQSYIDKHSTEEKQIWHYAEFECRTIINNEVHLYFKITDWYLAPRTINYKAFYFVSTKDLNDFIEEIETPPIDMEKYEVFIPAMRKDWEVKGLMFAWVVYIAAMIGCLIFKDFWIFWIIISIIFDQYRKGKIENDY